MTRPTHPIITAINQRDKAAREAGRTTGLWSVDEVAALFDCGRTVIYRLIDSGKLEVTNYGARSQKFHRCSSASLIAFVINNTTGPDEAALCTDLEKLIRTLSFEALDHLGDYIQARRHILSKGTVPAPRKVRRLSTALTEAQPEPGEPDLFTSLTQTPQA